MRVDGAARLRRFTAPSANSLLMADGNLHNNGNENDTVIFPKISDSVAVLWTGGAEACFHQDKPQWRGLNEFHWRAGLRKCPDFRIILDKSGDTHPPLALSPRH